MQKVRFTFIITFPITYFLLVDLYPKKVSVMSTSSASTKHPNVMGTYSKMQTITRNKKPVWEKIGDGKENLFYLFYTNTHWFFGANYSADVGHLEVIYLTSTLFPLTNGIMVMEMIGSLMKL